MTERLRDEHRRVRAVITTTPLGRSVSIDDWKAFQGDVVIKMLYDRTPLLGESGYRLLHRTLVNSSAMAVDELQPVLAYLCDLGFVESNYDSAWLAERGFEFARMHVNQARSVCPTCGR